MSSSERGLVPADLASMTAFCLEQLRLPSDVAADFAVLLTAAKRGAALVEQQGTTYLSLAALIAPYLQSSHVYLAALPHGRSIYRDEQYEIDEETGVLYRVPFPYTVEDVVEMVQEFIYLSSWPKMRLVIPLAFRAGLVVGWLSGLSISQPDEALHGMAVLAALVHPLLVAASVQPGDDKRLSAPGRSAAEKSTPSSARSRSGKKQRSR